MNISWKTVKDKTDYDIISKSTQSILSTLNLDLKKMDYNVFSKENLHSINELNERVLLLNRISQYLSVIQGKLLYYQKMYKSALFYSDHETALELNRSVRSEIDTIRTIISTERMLINIK